MSQKLQEFIDKQVDDAVELIFANAHGIAMTTSGDITPEQQFKLDELKEELKQLVTTQVTQNMDAPAAQKVHVTPYDDDMGVAWKLMFGDETVEDSFDSTADAEMWARDNGYIPVSHEISQAERELAVHKRHCSVNHCKYGEEDCPVVNEVVKKDGLPEVKHETPQPRIWTVEVCRTANAFKTIQVVATTEEEACDKAIDEAGGEEFGSGEADYSTPNGAY